VQLKNIEINPLVVLIRGVSIWAGPWRSRKKMEGWENIREANRAEKDPKKRKKLSRKPQKPSPPALSPKRPGAIYNGMIHPWAGYAVKGAIWYQGESNAGRAKEDETIFPLLIQDWRKQWKRERLFCFVQLANFRRPTGRPGQASSWAEAGRMVAPAGRGWGDSCLPPDPGPR